jgi:uncharacterized protein YcbK (DUF882 family)
MVDGRLNLTAENKQKHIPRRRFLQLLTAGSVAAVGFPQVSFSSTRRNFLPRELSFYNTHTGENASLTYFEGGQYLTEALQEIDNIFRDHRTDEVMPIDPNLLNLLYGLQLTLEVNKPFHIISGYRSPASNSMLHARTDGVARHSLHMQGKAVDIRIQGVDSRNIRDAAIFLEQGGVGYYASSDFVHVDTGAIRTW